MRLESVQSRLEFNERRARALEAVVQYKPEAPGGRGRDEQPPRSTRREFAAASAGQGAQGRNRRRLPPRVHSSKRAAAPVPSAAGTRPAAPVDTAAGASKNRRAIQRPSRRAASIRSPGGDSLRTRRRRRRRGRRSRRGAGAARAVDAARGSGVSDGGDDVGTPRQTMKPAKSDDQIQHGRADSPGSLMATRQSAARRTPPSAGFQPDTTRRLRVPISTSG